ncbi:MAG: 3-deoxy-manno-octulosonate cytidylyltransferase [Ilumatobacteraceae bacterium]|nr:3-deoxy-manno-octulosonate cytidylyltransferase [Ilumatobacteraceae bacterium]
MIVVIPARYASTRFPGKALADLGGRSVLRRCYEQVAKVVATDGIIVATDDQRIVTECERYEMRSIITSAACLTGTDRVAEVAQRIAAPWYINVQGDEPFLDPDGLRQLIRFTETASADLSIINACAPISLEADFRSVTVPKVVRDMSGNLLYISRAAIPTTKSLEFRGAFRQVGLYAFRAEALHQFAKQPNKTPLEALEDVEILRFLELGFRVAMIEVQENGIAIDTPEDLERAKQFLATT